MNSNTIKKVLEHYSVFGEPTSHKGSMHKLFRCPGWLNPIMSPILTRNGKFPDKSEVAALKSYFESIKTRKTPYDISRPYFNVITSGPKDTAVLTKKAQEIGFETLYATQTLCLFDHVRPFQLPDGSKVVFGEYFDRDLFKLMQIELKANFNSADLFLKEFNRMIRLAPGKTFSVMIQNKKNETMASGLFTIKGKHCALWSGSVSKRFRNRGLSRVTLELRKSISLGLGAESWIFFTRNPLMKDYFDSNVQMDSFCKTQTPNIVKK